MITYSRIMEMEPESILEWLTENFQSNLPPKIETADEMEEASRLLLALSGQYQYLCSLCSYAKLYTREMKRGGTKELHEDAVDKQMIIQNFTEGVKQAYAAVSRAVTIRIENNRELHMTGNVYPH